MFLMNLSVNLFAQRPEGAPEQMTPEVKATLTLQQLEKVIKMNKEQKDEVYKLYYKQEKSEQESIY